jgi:hypothetical protein
MYPSVFDVRFSFLGSIFMDTKILGTAVFSALLLNDWLEYKKCPEYAAIFKQHGEKWGEFVDAHILDNRRRPRWDNRKETVQQLGRWQPWHAGHRALFDRLIQKTGQVLIMVRDCQGWNNSNPFDFNQICKSIKRDLEPWYQ